MEGEQGLSSALLTAGFVRLSAQRARACGLGALHPLVVLLVFFRRKKKLKRKEKSYKEIGCQKEPKQSVMRQWDI